MKKLIVIPAIAIAAGLGLVACGGTAVTVTPAARATATREMCLRMARW
jgi:hypothetical protein